MSSESSEILLEENISFISESADTIEGGSESPFSSEVQEEDENKRYLLHMKVFSVVVVSILLIGVGITIGLFVGFVLFSNCSEEGDLLLQQEEEKVFGFAVMNGSEVVSVMSPDILYGEMSLGAESSVEVENRNSLLTVYPIHGDESKWQCEGECVYYEEDEDTSRRSSSVALPTLMVAGMTYSAAVSIYQSYVQSDEDCNKDFIGKAIVRCFEMIWECEVHCENGGMSQCQDRPYKPKWFVQRGATKLGKNFCKDYDRGEMKTILCYLKLKLSGEPNPPFCSSLFFLI